jgi:hypothetical protein
MYTPQQMGFASPGDLDLDFDVDNLTIFNLVVLDDELSFEIRGGFGSWSKYHDEPVAEVPASEDLVEEVTGSVIVGLPTDNERSEYRDWYVGRLRHWESRGTQLRLLSSPGRPSTLMEDQENWVVIPRSG